MSVSSCPFPMLCTGFESFVDGMFLTCVVLCVYVRVRCICLCVRVVLVPSNVLAVPMLCTSKGLCRFSYVTAWVRICLHGTVHAFAHARASVNVLSHRDCPRGGKHVRARVHMLVHAHVRVRCICPCLRVTSSSGCVCACVHLPSACSFLWRKKKPSTGRTRKLHVRVHVYVHVISDSYFPFCGERKSPRPQ